MSFLLLLAALPRTDGDTVTLSTRFSADPSPLVVGDRLYIYATHDEDSMTSYAMNDYNVFSTLDAVNWRDDGIAFSPTRDTTWATNAWAQQVLYYPPLDRYLMYFPGMGGLPGLGGDVGVATATDPRGPFADYAMTTIAPGEDPTVLIANDGMRILCSSVNTPYNMPFCGILNADMKSWLRNQSQVLITGLDPGDYFEAPWLFQRGHTYYLTFMQDKDYGGAHGAPFGWSLAYATNNSTDPLSPYTYIGPFLWANPLNCDDAAKCGDASGMPGGNSHHGFAFDWPRPGVHWLAYHTRSLAVTKREVTYSQRNVALDRVFFAPDGVLIPVTATIDWVRQQRYVDAYAVQSGAMMAAGSSVYFATQPGAADADGGMWRILTNITDGMMLRVAGVDFGASPCAADFTLRAAATVSGSTVAVHLDSPAGPLLAQVVVSSASFTNSTVGTVKGVGLGAHDVWFVFSAPAGATRDAPLMHVSSWLFSGGAATGATPPPVMPRVNLIARATGLFVAAAKDGVLGARSATAANFTIFDNEDSSWSIYDEASGYFVSAPTTGATRKLIASAATRTGAVWRMQGTPDGAYALSAIDGGIVVVQNDSGATLRVEGDAATINWHAGAALISFAPV